MARSFRIRSGIFGGVMTLICLAILFRQVDLKHSFNMLSGLNGPFLLLTSTVFLANLPLRSLRWQLIFSKASRPTFLSCMIALGIGNMMNFLLPGRAGDLARCVLVAHDTSLHESTRALATIAFEKVLDGLALVGLVLFSVWALHPPGWVLALVRMAALTFGIALVVLIFMRVRTEALIKTIRLSLRGTKLAFLEDRIARTLSSFADGLSALDTTRQILSLLLLTLGVWMSEVALIWAIAGAFRLPLTLQSAAVASAVLGLGLMIPAAPGGLGTYELFGTEVFQLAGMAASSALALTVVIHAWVFVSNIAFGTCLLAVKGLSLAQLKSRIKVESDALAPGSPSAARTSL